MTMDLEGKGPLGFSHSEFHGCLYSIHFFSDGHREEPQGPLPRRPGHRTVSTDIHDRVAMAMWLE